MPEFSRNFQILSPGGFSFKKDDIKVLMKCGMGRFCFLKNSVGLSMMSYRLWERKEDSFGGLPVERPHGEVVILPLSDSQLFLKILKGIEGVAGIEFFIVLSMTALHFPVVPGGVGLNELMPDAELLQGGFKERFLFGSLRVQAVREF